MCLCICICKLGGMGTPEPHLSISCSQAAFHSRPARQLSISERGWDLTPMRKKNGENIFLELPMCLTKATPIQNILWWSWNSFDFFKRDKSWNFTKLLENSRSHPSAGVSASNPPSRKSGMKFLTSYPKFQSGIRNAIVVCKILIE